MNSLDQLEALQPPNLPPEIRRRAELFMSPAARGRRFLFGRNEHSAALAQAIEIDGFVDDFASDATWQGKPVLKGQEIPPDAIVVNCVLMARSILASRRAHELCTSGCLEYADLMATFPERVPVPGFVEETRADFRRNRSHWTALIDTLADDESRQVLTDVLKFRLSGDIRHMQSYTFRPKDQYFEPFLNLPAGAVFVDCGGFDGDTTEEFCRRYPDYRKVYLFEPAAGNLQRARNRLKNLRDIEFIEKGLSDRAGTLGFNPEAGSASAISEAGSCQIEVTTLDEKVRERVSFIKMDLEGWELKALTGAQWHIREDQPHLAIAAYHQPSHFWQIFEQIIEVRSDYDIHLRHYTEGWIETVVFFVPRN